MGRTLASARATRQDFEDFSAEGVARELLGPRLEYDGDGRAVEPHDAGRIALPPATLEKVDIWSVVDDAAAEALDDFEHRILEDERVVRWRLTEGKVASHTDEVLRGDPEAYRQFLRSLIDCGILGATRHRRGAVTPFMVR